MAFGLLVPLFFVTSGMGVDPDAIVSEPGAFVVVVVLILLVRGLPVFVSTRLSRPRLDAARSAVVGLFAATGLPIIVAVTAVSVDAGQMTADHASLLIGAGAATVLLYPLAALTGPGPGRPGRSARGGRRTSRLSVRRRRPGVPGPWPCCGP